MSSGFPTRLEGIEIRVLDTYLAVVLLFPTRLEGIEIKVCVRGFGIRYMVSDPP